MAEQSRGPTASTRSLTAQAVVEEAIKLADAEGLEAVTIRKLAKRLGVTPMAIYWHVRNKDDLLDGVAASIFENAELSVDASASWQEQLRWLLESVVQVLRAHPAVAPLLSTRTVSAEAGLRATELMLDILRRAGFTPAEATQIARHALSTVTNLVVGEPGVVVRGGSGNRQDDWQRIQEHVMDLPPERYPRLVEAATPLTEGIDPDVYFAFGLELLLTGIEAMAERKR